MEQELIGVLSALTCAECRHTQESNSLAKTQGKTRTRSILAGYFVDLIRDHKLKLADRNFSKYCGCK